MLNKKEIKRQIKALWKKTDDLEKNTQESVTLSKYASDGYKDLYKYYKDIKSDSDELEKAVKEIKETIPQITVGIDAKLSSNLKWVIGIVLTLLSMYTGIIIYLITTLRNV